MKISKDSQSYKYLNKYDINYRLDFCSYYRAVIVNIGLMAAAGVIAGVLLACFISIPMLYFFPALQSMWMLPIGLMMWGVGIVLGGWWMVLRLFGKAKNTLHKQDSFIGTAYRSFKHKYCPIIEITK